jgi:ATP-binding cassette ChvD family protein
MKGVSKVYDSKVVLKDIWLSFFYGAKIGVIGYNGSGKSTLLRIMAGIDREIHGEAWASEDAKIGYLPQEPRLNPDKDVLGNIMEAVADKRALLDRFDAVSARFSEELDEKETDALVQEQADLQEKIDAQNLWDLDREIEIAMDALRCPPGDAQAAILSGGEKRRVALCKLVLQRPDMLLLDEPTNHLDAECVAWLERFLKEYPGTVIVVTHDRYFLDNVTEWILELDNGRGVPWKANYSSWLEQKEQELSKREKQDSARQKQLARELEWVRQSPRARRAKNKARISAYENLLDRQKEERLPGPAQIVIPPGPRLGNLVLEADKIGKSYGDRVLFENFSFSLAPGAIVGMIGPNGAGKTTLLRLITKEERPDSGELRMGDTISLGYIDQDRETLCDQHTVWEEISGGHEEISLGKRKVKSRAYCASFNFKGSDQQKFVGTLSGGERNRVHLAKMLRRDNNLILLDEPTNDLDVETLRALEEAMGEFAGCAIIVSHDRWFLDRLATHIIAFEGESKAVWFEGNYAAYEEDRKARLGEECYRPSRIKYKRLTR